MKFLIKLYFFKAFFLNFQIIGYPFWKECKTVQTALIIPIAGLIAKTAQDTWSYFKLKKQFLELKKNNDLLGMTRYLLNNLQALNMSNAQYSDLVLSQGTKKPLLPIITHIPNSIAVKWSKNYFKEEYKNIKLFTENLQISNKESIHHPKEFKQKESKEKSKEFRERWTKITKKILDNWNKNFQTELEILMSYFFLFANRLVTGTNIINSEEEIKTFLCALTNFSETESFKIIIKEIKDRNLAELENIESIEEKIKNVNWLKGEKNKLIEQQKTRLFYERLEEIFNKIKGSFKCSVDYAALKDLTNSLGILLHKIKKNNLLEPENDALMNNINISIKTLYENLINTISQNNEFFEKIFSIDENNKETKNNNFFIKLFNDENNKEKKKFYEIIKNFISWNEEKKQLMINALHASSLISKLHILLYGKKIEENPYTGMQIIQDLNTNFFPQLK